MEGLLSMGPTPSSLLYLSIPCLAGAVIQTELLLNMPAVQASGADPPRMKLHQ